MPETDVAIVSLDRRNWRAGPYCLLFYEAVEARGVPVVEVGQSGRDILREGVRHGFIHLHWPHFLYADRSRWRSIRRFAGIIAALAAARRRGCHIMWTVHNLHPHERCVVPWLDGLMRRYLAHSASRCFVHGASAEQAVLAAFPAMRGRTTIIDFGDVSGFYADTIARPAAREALGIADDEHAFLFFGQCRRYKNLEFLIATFARLPETAVLVIAGRFIDAALEAAVRQAIARCRRRVVLHAGLIADDAVQVYLRAGDTVVAPYTEILTSGTAVLAAAFGRPIVAPALGFLNDIVTPETGILYDAACPDGLEAAMLAAMRTRFDERTIRAAAARRSWQRSADIFIAACRAAGSRTRGGSPSFSSPATRQGAG